MSNAQYGFFLIFIIGSISCVEQVDNPTQMDPIAGMNTPPPLFNEPLSGTEMPGNTEEGCNPDEIADELCITCGEDGSYEVPEADENCPTIECPTDEYEIDAQGSCVRTLYSEAELPLCDDINVCQSLDEQACVIQETEVVFEGDACSEIISCEAGAMPEVSPRVDGSLCNDWGTCNNGECSARLACSTFTRYNQQNFFCESEVNDEGHTLCMFFVNGRGLNNDGRTTCTEFCERDGGTCVNGWNNDNNSNCRRGNGNDGCNVSYETQICICQAN